MLELGLQLEATIVWRIVRTSSVSMSLILRENEDYSALISQIRERRTSDSN